MGQRSQIYFRINDQNGKYNLVARYFQWNYGTRMVSRARGIIEWLESMKDYPYTFLNRNEENIKKLERIIEINFDYKDIVLSHDIIKEYEEDYYGNSKEMFTAQDNNDGQLLIDMVVDWEHENKEFRYPVKFKYAFLNDDSELVGNGDAYMQWNEHYGEEGPSWKENPYVKDEVKYTERNIRYLDKHATVMTQEEVEEYISHDYVSDMGLKRKED